MEFGLEHVFCARVVWTGSELSTDVLLLLHSVVSVLLPLLRYVTSDVENSEEVSFLYRMLKLQETMVV